MTVSILALETSSSLCGVALLTQSGEKLSLHALEHDATAEHAERLLPMVDQLLAEQGVGRDQLAAIAFGQGPGGFTGLRVACGVAQGMAFALDIPVIPVPSLLAAAARDPAPFFSGQLHVIVQDARMDEVYLAAYRLLPGALGADSKWQPVQEPVLLGVDQVGRWLDHAGDLGQGRGGPAAVRVLGDALSAYPALSRELAGKVGLEIGPALRPDASAIARLALRAWHAGQAIAPELAAPLYVRDKVAYTTLERQQGAGGNPRAPEFQVSLEAMRAEHLDEVADIEQRVQSFPWSRGNFADGLEAGYGAWVARLAGRTMGFCMAMFAPDVAHVLVIAVAPEGQKRGIGGLLLAHCEQEAMARGLPAMVLEVRPSNVNALEFYRGRGYELLAMRKDYYPAAHGRREDACIMRKALVAETGDSA
ncbi:MAG: tRNA (adenosine(37)-N6)-threonylcarbamoyltransferase complex dimerization subunit type 1 TsaB [Burkholderiaceae bacterium]